MSHSWDFDFYMCFIWSLHLKIRDMVPFTLYDRMPFEKYLWDNNSRATDRESYG